MRRIINDGRKQRMLYASEEDAGNGKSEFMLSAMPEVKHTRRPVARFDTQQELEQEAARRGCAVTWQ